MSAQGTKRRHGGALLGGGIAGAVVLALWTAGAVAAAPLQGPQRDAPAAVSFAGRVVDPSGKRVEGATVRLVAEAGRSERTVTSGAAGEFAIEGLPAGRYRLTATAPGYQRFTSQVDLEGAESEYRVVLRYPAFEQEIRVSSALPELTTGFTLSGRQVLETAPEDLGAGLRGASGVSAVRRGSINLEPTVRGLQETQVAMFVDGTRTFAAGPARMDSDLSHVSPQAVESVQVVKGPYALAWGAGALSAVRVDTYRPDFSPRGFDTQGAVHLGYGGNGDAEDTAARVAGAGERFRFLAFGGRRHGSNYTAGDGTTVPGDYDSQDFRWLLASRVGGGGLLEYTGGYQEQNDLDYPGRILDATYFYTHSHALEYTWRPAAGAVGEVYAQVYTNRKDHRMNNDDKPTARPDPNRVPPFALDVAITTESNTRGGRFHVDLGKGALSWRLGVDTYLSEQSADRVVSRRDDAFVLFEDVVWPDAEIDDLGAYAQLRWEEGGARLGATVRLDRVDATSGRASDFFLAHTSGDLDQQETHLSTAVSGRFEVREGWAVTAGLGRAVRTATALERYSDRFPSTRFQIPAEFLGDPGIDPETALELDLGTELRLAGAALLEVELFYRVIDDYITVMPDPDVPKRLPLSPPVVFRYVNGTEATFLGGEAQVSGEVRGWVRWQAGLSYVRGEDELFGEPALGMPPLTGTLDLELRPPAGRWWVGARTTVADRQDRVAARRFEVPTPGYAVLDLRGGCRLSGGLEASAGVTNLGDRAYADHLNAKNPFTGERIPERGRSFFAGLGYTF